MRSVLMPLGSLLFATMLLLAGNGLLTTVIALRMVRAEFLPVLVGLVMSAYFGGFTLGSLYADRVIRGVGHIRAFSSFAAATAAVALCHALVPIGWPWAALRGLSGFTMAGLIMSIESWLNAACPNEMRGRVIAVYMSVVYFGLGAGQLLLNTWSVDGLELFGMVGLLMCLAVLPVALTRTPAPTLERHERLSMRSLFALASPGVVAACAAGAMSASIYAAAPIYADASGFTTTGTSLFMTALIVGGLVLQWPLGKLSDRFDRRVVLLALHVGIALVALVCGGVSPGLGLGRGLVLAAIFGGLVFSVYGIALAYVFDRVEHASILTASAGMMMAFAFGSIAGPLLASSSMTWLGPEGFFVCDGLLALVVVGIAWRDVRTQAPVPPEERETFVAVPRTTPVASELDPRAPVATPELGGKGEPG